MLTPPTRANISPKSLLLSSFSLFFPFLLAMAQRSETDGFRVIIAGGGIAGLTLANCLQHAGIDYVLLEARSVIAPQVGASIGMMPNGSRILDQLGCYDEIAGMIEPMLMSGCHYETGEFIGKENDGPQLAGKRQVYRAHLDHHEEPACPAVKGKSDLSVDFPLTISSSTETVANLCLAIDMAMRSPFLTDSWCSKCFRTTSSTRVKYS